MIGEVLAILGYENDELHIKNWKTGHDILVSDRIIVDTDPNAHGDRIYVRTLSRMFIMRPIGSWTKTP